jgi:protein TonB
LSAWFTLRPCSFSSREGLQRIVEEPMQFITIRPPLPPPPAPAKPPAPQAQPRKAASPPTKRPLPPRKPPPAVAPVAVAAAADTDLSASLRSGASLGSIGTGLDLGGGGVGGLARHAEWVDGGLGNRDYPEAAKRARLQGVVDVLFTVLTNGRVRGCRIDHSSGSADLDRLTCALVEQRLLYNPALDASGKPVEEVAGRRIRFAMSPRRDR